MFAQFGRDIKDAASVNLRVALLLEQSICVGLFPEGTTTDGKQIWHFRSSLIQPAIDADVMLCPIALRYQGKSGKQSSVTVFTGDTTLSRSPPRWQSQAKRRVLARAAQEAIAQRLNNIAAMRQVPEQEATSVIRPTLFSAQSTYAPLLLPLPNQPPK